MPPSGVGTDLLTDPVKIRVARDIEYALYAGVLTEHAAQQLRRLAAYARKIALETLDDGRREFLVFAADDHAVYIQQVDDIGDEYVDCAGEFVYYPQRIGVLLTVGFHNVVELELGRSG